MRLITTHTRGSHAAVIDDVWTIKNCRTEIELVRELAKCGINLKEFACVNTTGEGENIQHRWYKI